MSRSWLLGLLALLFACKGEDSIVEFNVDPTVIINDPEEGSIWESGEPITFRALVDDDAPIEQLELQWSSSVSGNLDSTTVPDADGKLDFITSNLLSGEHLITLRAFDVDGGQGAGSVTVIVEVVPEAPSISVIHPDIGEQGAENSLYTFEVEVDDRQDAPPLLLVEMKSTIDTDGDGIPDIGCYMVAGGDGHATCTPTTPLPVGNHFLTFTVEDTEGNTATRNASFDVLALEDLDQDGDGWTTRQGDCNDLNKLMNPEASELCDSLDNDCDPLTPIDGPQTECWDDDGDGYCETGACANAAGTIPDCDDGNPQAFPSSTAELPNKTDDNCNGTVDENTVRYDDDGDGYCESGDCENTTETKADCIDTNPDANPAEIETCDPGNVDNDCDGEWNEKNAPGCTKYYSDADGDGYGSKSGTSECWCPPGKAPYTGLNNTDCLDTDANTHPGQNTYFTSKRADNANFDYNCNGADEKQYLGKNTGCVANFFALDCELSSPGWQGSEAACGKSGTYINDCSTNFGGFSCIDCFASPSVGTCSDCLTCDPDQANQAQGCR